MASERYGFFQGAPGDDREYDSENLATAFLALASTGVRMLGTNLQVTVAGGSMDTIVGYGIAMLCGRYYTLYDDGGGAKTFTHTTSGGLNRIDRIVLRLDLTTRTITVNKVIGVAGASAEAPALTRTSEIYEISLAQVLIRAGASVIEEADITDERADDTVCGLIAPESLRPSTVQAMIDAVIAAQISGMLKYTEQALSTAQKDVARWNIDAQLRIYAAAGMLKTDGLGNISRAVPNADYAPAVLDVYATLTVAGWSGAAAPYDQTVSVAGVTAASKVSVGLSELATDAEYQAALSAAIRATSLGAGTVTVRCTGDLPAIDLPILVRIVGVTI